MPNRRLYRKVNTKILKQYNSYKKIPLETIGCFYSIKKLPSKASEGSLDFKKWSRKTINSSF
jgi:hypothetical protein